MKKYEPENVKQEHFIDERWHRELFVKVSLRLNQILIRIDSVSSLSDSILTLKLQVEEDLWLQEVDEEVLHLMPFFRRPN